MEMLRNNDLCDNGSYPWEGSESLFSTIRDGKRIETILNEARELHLFMTPVAGDGRIFSRSLLIGLNSGILQVDKPLDWDENITDFRLFFRRVDNFWHGFKVGDFVINPFTISFSLPEEICFLQRRRSPRMTLPNGSWALLRKNGKLMNSLSVRNISVDGMLICTGSKTFGMDREVELRDIIISIPADGSKPGRILPPIDKGAVVRSFFEEESNSYCHGVSFRYDSPYVREALSWLHHLAD